MYEPGWCQFRSQDPISDANNFCHSIDVPESLNEMLLTLRKMGTIGVIADYAGSPRD